MHLIAESRQCGDMDDVHSTKISKLSLSRGRLSKKCNSLKSRIQQWQQVRSWGRLIRAAQNLWKVDAKEVRRLGALELLRLFQEVPPTLKNRVHRWLEHYASSTKNIANAKRLKSK